MKNILILNCLELEPEPKIAWFFGSGSSKKVRLRAAPAPKHWAQVSWTVPEVRHTHQFGVCIVGALQPAMVHAPRSRQAGSSESISGMDALLDFTAYRHVSLSLVQNMFRYLNITGGNLNLSLGRVRSSNWHGWIPRMKHCWAHKQLWTNWQKLSWRVENQGLWILNNFHMDLDPDHYDKCHRIKKKGFNYVLSTPDPNPINSKFEFRLLSKEVFVVAPRLLYPRLHFLIPRNKLPFFSSGAPSN